MIISRRRHVDALVVKPGPTQSGGINGQPRTVGGVALPGWNPLVLGLLVLLLLSFAFLLYKRRSLLLRLLGPIISRLPP